VQNCLRNQKNLLCSSLIIIITSFNIRWLHPDSILTKISDSQVPRKNIRIADKSEDKQFEIQWIKSASCCWGLRSCFVLFSWHCYSGRRSVVMLTSSCDQLMLQSVQLCTSRQYQLITDCRPERNTDSLCFPLTVTYNNIDVDVANASALTAGADILNLSVTRAFFFCRQAVVVPRGRPWLIACYYIQDYEAVDIVTDVLASRHTSATVTVCPLFLTAPLH